jgi:hypothetical protein
MRPALGGPPTSYILAAGSLPGWTDRAILRTESSETTWSAPIDGGTFYVRAHAVNGAGMSPPSNEIQVTICRPPVLSATVIGSTVSLTWRLAPAILMTAYTIEVGSAAGLSDLRTLRIGGLASSYDASNVPAGTYFVRVRASNNSGSSPPSNEVVVVVP